MKQHHNSNLQCSSVAKMMGVFRPPLKILIYIFPVSDGLQDATQIIVQLIPLKHTAAEKEERSLSSD